MLFRGAARSLRSDANLGSGSHGQPRLAQRNAPHLATFSAAMTWLMVAAEAASPMGVAPRKMVTGLVSTATMTRESPFTLRAASAIVTSASTRAALIPSTVIDDVLVGPRVGEAFA